MSCVYNNFGSFSYTFWQDDWSGQCRGQNFHISQYVTVCLCAHPLIIATTVCVVFVFLIGMLSCWSKLPKLPLTSIGENMGWLSRDYAPNCCYMVLEGYMLLLFLYVVAYFPDLGTVGNNDCCCRSNDVGNFFFLFHIYLLALSQPPWTPLLSLSPPVNSVETPF